MWWCTVPDFFSVPEAYGINNSTMRIIIPVFINSNFCIGCYLRCRRFFCLNGPYYIFILIQSGNHSILLIPIFFWSKQVMRFFSVIIKGFQYYMCCIFFCHLFQGSFQIQHRILFPLVLLTGWSCGSGCGDQCLFYLLRRKFRSHRPQNSRRTGNQWGRHGCSRQISIFNPVFHCSKIFMAWIFFGIGIIFFCNRAVNIISRCNNIYIGTIIWKFCHLISLFCFLHCTYNQDMISNFLIGVSASA